jgi:hypothetical protein
MQLYTIKAFIGRQAQAARMTGPSIALLRYLAYEYFLDLLKRFLRSEALHKYLPTANKLKAGL